MDFYIFEHFFRFFEKEGRDQIYHRIIIVTLTIKTSLDLFLYGRIVKISSRNILDQHNTKTQIIMW